ncbi:MAG: diaminopimelate epimerase [bacterium]
MNFTKMHGAGNDYIYIDGFKEKVENPNDLAVKLSDRHFGIGGDGLILILPSDAADCRMRIFNADGSEAQMCGNGIRCVAKYVYDSGIARKREMRVETKAGVLTLQLFPGADGKIESVRVNMGRPIFHRHLIPMLGPDDGPVIDEELNVGDRTFRITALSIGNPHCVIFVDDVEHFPVERYGPMVENHPRFPERVNAEFVQVLNRNEVRMRVWERGSGETLACGTGASAVCVASRILGKTDHKITAHLLGGDLEMEWQGWTPMSTLIDLSHQGEAVYMTGPAAEVFRGTIEV